MAKSTTMSFEEFLEDILDQHAGLMSDSALAAAREAYEAWIAPKKAATKPVALEINGKPAKASEGLAYARRNAANQEKAMARAIARNANSQGLAAYLLAAQAAIDSAKALGEKPRKAEIAAAIRLNQAASQAANAL